MAKFKLKDNLTGLAGLIAAVIAIGGGFSKFAEMDTKLQALSAATAPDISGIEKNIKDIAVLQKEIELLNLLIKEMKAKADNPLGG